MGNLTKAAAAARKLGITYGQYISNNWDGKPIVRINNADIIIQAPNKKCEQCGEMFYSKTGRAKYCSEECNYNHKKSLKKYERKDGQVIYHKVCSECGKNYDSFSARQMTCSDECGKIRKTRVKRLSNMRYVYRKALEVANA